MGKTSQILKQHISVGDMIIGHIPHTQSDAHLTSEKPKARPAMIWGVYYDKHNNIYGFDVLLKTTVIKSYKSVLHTTPCDFTHLNSQDDREGTILTNSIVTIRANRFTDLKQGPVRQVKPCIFPDIVAHRAYALNFEKRHIQYKAVFDFNRAKNRKGFVFNNISMNNVRQSVISPDLNGVSDLFNIPNHAPDRTRLSQDDVNAIARWVHASVSTHGKANFQWPEKGTWPNWPDVKYNGEVVKCCSDLTAIERDHFMEKPKKPTAAATRAARFGNFTL